MNQSMYTGQSALLSYQNALNVESNNLANVNTVAFKSDSTSFSDLMYQGGVGMGTSMTEPTKKFNEGELVQTAMDYDFAIKGDGFFTVKDPYSGGIYYTRAGNFHRSKENNLVDVMGMEVQGVVPTVSGDKITEEFTKVVGSSIIEDDQTLISINTFSTDYTQTAVNTGVSGSNYKTASANISDIEELTVAYKNAISAYEKNIEQGEEVTIAKDIVSYPVEGYDDPYTLELFVNGVKYQQQYDTSVENTLKLFSDQINTTTGITSSVDTTTGELTIESIIPGEKMTVSNAVLNENKVPITEEQVATGSGQNLVDAIYSSLKNLVEANGGKLATTTSTLNKTQSGTMPVTTTVNLDLDSLGISSNSFGELENDNGDLYLVQGDAKYLVGQLSPVVFQENSSLRPEGHNLYSSTEASGDPLYVAEYSEVVNSYLEMSNTNLSDGLVNLMVLQKAYDANSKTITTSDELLKTALALKN